MFRFDAIMAPFFLRGVGLLAVTLALNALFMCLAFIPPSAALSSGLPLAKPVVWAFCLGISLLYLLSSRLFSRSLSPQGEPPAANRLAWVLAMVLGSAHLALLLFSLIALPSSPDDVTAMAGPQLMLNLETVLTNGITVILIVLLLCIELTILLLIRFDVLPAIATRPRPVNYKLMRPAIFLFLFGIDLSMAFLPLHMETLYRPIFGLSRDVIMGLPISVEFLCVGVAIIGSGVWVDRRGWREPFLCGLLLAVVGGLYSWLASDALHFITARGIVGLGYGLTLLASQGFVIRNTDARSKAQGLAHLMAGLYSGSICGAATGAMLAERFGYQAVFLAGAVIVAGVLLYSGLFLRQAAESRLEVPLPGADDDCRSVGAIRRFLRNRRVLAAILFSSLPASVAAVGFLNYFSPVYLSRLAVPESTIGQVLMLFGLSLTLLGPAIGRWVDASENKVVPILLGCLLGSGAFLVFSQLQGIAAAMVAVLLLGLSNCFVLPAQSAFVLQQDVTRQLGDGKAMGIFRSTSRIGQMLGPVLFAWLLIAADLEKGVVYFGLAYLLTALLFPLMAGTNRNISETAVT